LHQYQDSLRRTTPPAADHDAPPQVLRARILAAAVAARRGRPKPSSPLKSRWLIRLGELVGLGRPKRR
jgi:hypothetical protein